MNKYYKLVDSKIVPTPSKADKNRIDNLHIPPAWKDVRINMETDAKVQVIGYDSKDREQRIYHENWIKESSFNKYKHVNSINYKYKNFDKILERFMKRNDLSYEYVVAYVVKLLIVLNIRVGNDIYFEENGTCGLTTMRRENVKIIDGQYFLNFTGKSGIEHNKHIESIRIRHFLDKMIKHKQDKLFCYNKETEFVPVTSCDINSFIKEHLGDSFTSKDLRTYSANKIFKETLRSLGCPRTEKDKIKFLKESIKHTALELGNTVKVCRDSYIDPIIIERYNKKFSFCDT
jgi:DNA topoisomerase-1